LLLFLLVLSSPAACVGPSGVADRVPDHDGPLAELAWMAGHWAGESDGIHMEEYWLAPRGGLMLGLHRDVTTKGGAFFEYLRIEQDEHETVYHASPQGRRSTPFQLIESEGTRAVFENKAHDFPQRILYRLDEDGRLHARIEGEEKGVAKSMDWVYHKVR
jgi:hypothetical protein